MPRRRSRLAYLWPVVLVLVCSVALAAIPTASADARAAKRLGRCDAHLAKPLRVKATRRVVVWRREVTGASSGEPAEVLYACLRPAGRSVEIGQNDQSGAEYVGNTETSPPSISGTLVNDVVTSGFAAQEACGKYDGTNCAAVVHVVARVYNMLTGRSIRQRLGTPTSAYAFSPLGAIAWETPLTESETVLQAVSFAPSSMHEGAVETLDEGALGSSLHFSGLTLAWTNAGQPKSERIRPELIPSAGR
jgi:hypothetical protein